MLRNIPLILVGGLRAWKSKFGPEELVRGSTESSTEVPSTSSHVLQNVGASPLTNGIASPRPNGSLMVSAPACALALTSQHSILKPRQDPSGIFDEFYYEHHAFAGLYELRPDRAFVAVSRRQQRV